MAKHMVVDKDKGADIVNDGESMTLSMDSYPELQNAEVGQAISGTWSGRVVEVNDDKVKIEYDSMELETENSADKEMRSMAKQPMGGVVEE